MQRKLDRRVALATLAAAIATAPGASHAEATRLSLPEMQERALHNSALMAAHGHELAAANAHLDEAAGYAWPTVSSLLLTGVVPEARGDAVQTATPVDDYGYVLEGLGPFFRGELRVTQPLWTFGKISSATEAADALVGLRAAEGDSLRWRVRTQVALLYHGWLFLEETLHLVTEIEEKAGKAGERLEEKLTAMEAGVRPTDRLKLKAFLAEIDSRRVDAEVRLEHVQNALGLLLGDGAAGDTRPQADALRPLEYCLPALESSIEEALQQHPELRRIGHGIAAVEAKQRGMRALYFPDLFLTGRVRYGVAPNRDDQRSAFANDDFNFFDAGVGLGLKYSWDVGMRGAALAAATAELAALQSKREALLQKLGLDLRATHRQLTGLRQQLGIRRRAFKATRAWSISASNSFQLGSGQTRELVEALREHIRARFALLETVYAHNTTVAQLSAAAGSAVTAGGCDEGN